MRPRGGLGLCLVWAACAAASCGSVCGLGLHGRITFDSGSAGTVPCCGGFLIKDVSLTGDDNPEFGLTSTGLPKIPGLVDAFLVPTSCAKLFDGSYPGAVPLCRVLLGPAAPGTTSSRARLPAGPYRLWLQGYSSNTTNAPYLVDIDVWDHSCRSPLLQ
jgi:hypothetical protein